MSDETPQIQFLDDTLVVPFAVDAWPGVSFAGTVRPPTVAEVRAADKAAGESKDPTRARCEFYARHVKSWNLPGPVTAANVARLPPAVYGLLDSVLVGGLGCEMVLGKSAGSSPS